MHIYLVRHTEYWNPDSVYAFHLPFYLSENGREHAQRIGSWFAEQHVHQISIYASPIVRTVQTAEIIAAKTSSFVRTDVRLIESFCSNLQGKKIPSVEPWKVEENDPTRESHESEYNRIVSIFTDVRSKNEDCILVSHGDPLTLLYYHLLEKDPPQYFWDPENAEHVIRRGEIVRVETSPNTIRSVERIQV